VLDELCNGRQGELIFTSPDGGAFSKNAMLAVLDRLGYPQPLLSLRSQWWPRQKHQDSLGEGNSDGATRDFLKEVKDSRLSAGYQL
jgi:hypothetical protein